MRPFPTPVSVREIAAADFSGAILCGSGPDVVGEAARRSGRTVSKVLDSIVNKLLVNKGADWTAPILAEYIGLYDDSLGTFALILDGVSGNPVAHGAVFQSASNPGTGLIAHIRTDGQWYGRGLGTMVTEEVTQAAFANGARLAVLATDDKRHRLDLGEKAAHRMYSKIGYAVLAEKELADTVDWLMVIDRNVFERCRELRQVRSRQFPEGMPPDVKAMQLELIGNARRQFGCRISACSVRPVRAGDLAGLFLLLNLSPPGDFRLKLASWGVQSGPEFERSFVVGGRPSLLDRDRLEDASMVLCDGQGNITAVCAARQSQPFTRHTMQIDFYCLPEFLVANRGEVSALITATLQRIQQADTRPRPCRMIHTGADPAKMELFAGLGFIPGAHCYPHHAPDGAVSFTAQEYVNQVD